MRDTVRDWKDEWIEENGITDELEVIVGERSDSFEDYLYEGSFAKIPEELLDKKVIEFYKVVCSTVTERVGAYKLMV